jgi:hypothetical protein
VAKAAGVSIQSVKILNIVSHAGRRLLEDAQHMTVRLAIFGSTNIDHSMILAQHSYVNNVTWEHDHHIDVSPVMQSFRDIY